MERSHCHCYCSWLRFIVGECRDGHHSSEGIGGHDNADADARDADADARDADADEPTTSVGGKVKELATGGGSIQLCGHYHNNRLAGYVCDPTYL